MYVDYRLGNIAGFIAILIWSVVPLLVTLCAGVPLLPFLSIVCFVTFGSFLISWTLRGQSLIGNLRTSPKALAITTVGNGISRGMFWSSLLLIDPAQAALINNLWTMLAAVAGALLVGAGLRFKHLIALACGVTAVVVLVSGPEGLMAGFTPPHLMALGSGIVWAGYTA